MAPPMGPEDWPGSGRWETGGAPEQAREHKKEKRSLYTAYYCAEGKERGMMVVVMMIPELSGDALQKRPRRFSVEDFNSAVA